jgi:hypothetical protein
MFFNIRSIVCIDTDKIKYMDQGFSTGVPRDVARGSARDCIQENGGHFQHLFIFYCIVVLRSNTSVAFKNGHSI